MSIIATAIRDLKEGSAVTITCANRGESEGWYAKVKPSGEFEVYFNGAEPWAQQYSVSAVASVLSKVMLGELAPNSPDCVRSYDSCLRYA